MGGETTPSRSSTSSYPQRTSGPVGKKIHNIYIERLKQFTDEGQYRGDGLWAKMYEGRASGEKHVKLSTWAAPGQERPSFEDATSHEFKPTKVGTAFGPSWATHWFKVQLTVPDELKDKKHLEFHWDSNSEAMIWSKEGVPLQGLTGGGERQNWIFPDSFRDGKEHVFYVEMACNGMFGNSTSDSIQPPNPDRYFAVSTADIVAINLDARALYIDYWIIGDAAREFPQDSWEEHEALSVCTEIMECFIAGSGSKECIKDCRKLAQRYIGDKVDSAKVYDGSEESLVNGIGYCHIDTCWLWPFAETKRKVARSWASQCNLIEQFPEYRFCCSQAQQYKWLEQYYPELYDRVKSKVKEGSFQPIGGSWVEHDTNLPGGESLVRQFLYGQRYFESHFGQRNTTFWLPDTFGYSSQIPQLCRLAGMSRFLTQKLSWNNINNFPHTTFNWVALDGSQVLCHMPPSQTYTADAHFGDVRRSVTQHKSMDQDPTSLLVYGKGDGGGGPTWEMLEKLRRCRGMSDKVGLLPRVHLGNSADDFFARLEKKVEKGTKFTTWYGELYFELHRGTYTTQADNKRSNRKAEIMLHDIEYLATIASITKDDYQYPKKDIDDMWEAVLLCQFHDCLPGSSIEMCYDESDKMYAAVFKTGEKLLSDLMSELGFLPASSGGDLFAVNTLSWPRSTLVPLDNGSYGVANGELGLSAIEPLPRDSDPSVSVREISPGIFKMSNSLFDLKVHNGIITSIYDKSADREVIPPGAKANQYVIFDDKPNYWQAWDVEVFHLDTRRELENGKSTILESTDQRVVLMTETRISDVSWIKTTITLTAGEVSSDDTDDEDAITTPLTPEPFIAIHSEIEWHEDKKFLKVEFPVDVHNTDASYETQFGIVRRPTHYNTTWDMAKFEVCCHKWADLSEAGYGVSILNDSKFGFATVGNVMRLSLLRAPKAPDAHADMGRHHIAWAIMPHKGGRDHRTVRAAFEFNYPLVGRPQWTSNSDSEALTTSTPAPLFPYTSTTSFIRTHASPATASARLGAFRLTKDSDPAIILDTIKRGEDDEDVVADVVRHSHDKKQSDISLAVGGKGAKRSGASVLPVRKGKGKSVVLRMYDSLGGRARGRVVVGGKGSGIKVEKVFKCNLLEDDGDEVKFANVVYVDGSGEDGEEGSVFKVELRPFEVASYRVVLA